MAVRKKTETAIVPLEIKQGRVEFHILGKTPLYYNAMSAKTKNHLLKPPGRKTAAQKANSLKHIPLEEFRDSVYRLKMSETGPTRLVAPSRWFKQSVAQVAKRIPGATKTEIQQLMWVADHEVPCYGVPQISLAVVRSADINRTPDIRTRAVLPQWCAKISIEYIQPQLNADSLAKLLMAAGVICGVGDWRQEKGSGNFGQFTIVDPNDKQYQAVLKSGGLKAQDAALNNPVAFDEETERMLAWFDDQMESSEHDGLNGSGLEQFDNDIEVEVAAESGL